MSNVNIDLLIRTSESAKSVKDLRNSLRELKTAAMSVNEGSVEFNK